MSSEEPFIESIRRRVEEQYSDAPTGCGGILCWKLHSNVRLAGKEMGHPSFASWKNDSGALR